ncbi:MAG: hypothetical protein FJ207_04670 [Gemmatimonadetes bacterium]|nr:hypothetical protein [Gemmatimonadota bacterium]
MVLRPRPRGVALLFSIEAPAAISSAETDALSTAFALVDTYHVIVLDSLTETTLVDATLNVAAGGS